ncbi:MAG: hypothetical protein M3033_03675, partial [Acidobacteriota bacterium]|nr:hypothetical protein [Acidobacteriota bacterium]
MNAFVKQFITKSKINLTAVALLLGILLVGAARVSAQQNSLVSDNRYQPSPNFSSALVSEGERGAKFRYVSMKGSDDINVQFYVTTALALAAGFDINTANSIGLYNQYVDDNPKTSATSNLFNFKARRDYHFTSEKQRAKLWQAFVAAPNAANLGIFMHANQDSFFHAGYNYVIGHMFKGVRPDQSWRPENAVKSKNAARAIFEKMLEATPLLGAIVKPLDYADIEPQTLDFLNAADDSERGIRFARLVGRISTLRGGQSDDTQLALTHIFRAIITYSF